MCEDGEKYCFIVDYYDPQASMTHRYTLTFHDADNSVELYDPRHHRRFLRRSKTDHVTLNDMYIGNSMNIFGRQLTIVGYGDENTRARLAIQNERTLAIVKPDAMCYAGIILDTLWKGGLHIANLKTMFLSKDEVSEFYIGARLEPGFTQMVEYISSGPILVMEIKGERALQRWQDMAGPRDPASARQCNPHSLQAKFGKNTTEDACHASADAETAAHEIDFFFPTKGPKRRNTACFQDCTLGVIKPHIIHAGLAGEIIRKIIDCGFQVCAMIMVNLDKANAEEFLEIYKGVVQEYPQMVTELCSGPCIAMEIRAQNAQQVFREFVGPADPEIARHLRPKTLRALYGKTKIQNAIHCTDLPEDAELEAEYFFRVLDA